jgi:hypothetical protein
MKGWIAFTGMCEISRDENQLHEVKKEWKVRKWTLSFA